MRHPYERFIKIELISLILAIIIGLLAIIKANLIWLSLSLYLTAISLFCDSIVAQSTHLKVRRIKQLIRFVLLFFLATLLIFKL
ncbi:hypothetical protein KQI49_00085 [Virgibacillus sp. MSJ-26]|uniref:hypothetical protein n=1 Tax=Virgibacillus sp. MSJ-26 TaxID=2841522 RepID=UPI001C11523F|nr:hypothetical protein [Virgibacillus sp. MSJ-26]MBU5465223.1 hypothetical protein [Virgibacillus sp. MSJ-26]